MRAAKSHSILLRAVLTVGLTIAASLPAESSIWKDDDYFVDEFIASERCADVQKLLHSRQRSPTLQKGEVTEAELKRAHGICAKYKARSITLEEWDRTINQVGWPTRLVFDDSHRNTTFIPVPAQGAQIDLPPSVPAFPVYATMLVTNSSWIVDSEDVQTLREAFKRFGQTIGNRGAAIWFSSAKYPWGPDIKRSKHYARKLKLPVNGGPYIVLSQRRPDRIAPQDVYFYVKFDNISPRFAERVLNVLEEDLLNGRQPSQLSIIFEELTQRLVSVPERNPWLQKAGLGVGRKTFNSDPK